MDKDPDAVVRVSAAMSREQRRAAIDALASGIDTVVMPASWEVLQGRGVHADDRYPIRGVVTFEARDHAVVAERRSPNEITERRVRRYGRDNGPFDRPMRFTGTADPATREIRGTVAFDLRSYNRKYAALALIGGLLMAVFVPIGGYPWPWVLLVVPVTMALLLPLRYVWPRRRARIMLPDLQRFAALASGEPVMNRLPSVPRPPRPH